MSLGIIRQTYDVLENSLYFYSKETMLYRLPVSEIEKSDSAPYIIGDTLDVAKVKSAIEDLEEKKLSIIEFHRELAKAGVVYVSVFLNKKQSTILVRMPSISLKRTNLNVILLKSIQSSVSLSLSAILS